MLDLFNRKKTTTKKEVAGNVRDMLDYLVEHITDDTVYSTMSSRVTKFAKLSKDKQIKQLPETYLLIEQYVTELRDDEGLSRTEIRKQIKEKYPFAADLDLMKVIFLEPDQQPIGISRIFILSVIEKGYNLLGATGDKMLISLKDWIETIPEKGYTPIPFRVAEELPSSYDEWYQLVFNISHKLYANLESKFGEEFTRKIYENSYNDIANHYKGLEEFSMMIKLLPLKILDGSQVDILSKKNKENILNGRVNTLTELNEKISKQAEELQAAYDIISVKNQEITESIDYAKIIQFSAMSEPQDFRRIFKESFIFFKPRDIVSGDFYWFKRIDTTKEPKYIIAAVDCTGHGVPGAFMSLVGINNLNTIVNYSRIFDPSVIANRLHTAIKRLFSKRDDEMNDGMDLSICSINPNRRTLDFAGAKNSLVFFQEGNMKVFKGDRHSIGEHEEEGHPVAFTKLSVKLNKPTTCYIFSDGFEDQIGGPHNRKYKRVRFFKLLERIHQLPMKEQNQLLEKELHDWINPEEGPRFDQIDDILVMGFKIDIQEK